MIPAAALCLFLPHCHAFCQDRVLVCHVLRLGCSVLTRTVAADWLTAQLGDRRREVGAALRELKCVGSLGLLTFEGRPC